MPEYGACELDEIRHRQRVDDAVRKYCNPESEKECELVVDKWRIKQALKKSRSQHTVRVRSRLP